MTIKKQVFQALDHALTNDYFMFLQNAPTVVATDLTEYDVELETVEPAELIPHVEAWFQERNLLRYYSDDARHLICVPYSVNNLHAMAADLGIKRGWFHSHRRHPHYDIPKRRVDEIAERTNVVSTRELFTIIQDCT